MDGEVRAGVVVGPRRTGVDVAQAERRVEENALLSHTDVGAGGAWCLSPVDDTSLAGSD